MKLGTKIAITMSALVVCVLALLGIVDVSRDQEFFEADTTRDHVVLADLLAGSVEQQMRHSDRGEDIDLLLRSSVRREGQLHVAWGWVGEPARAPLPPPPQEVWARVESGRWATFRVGGRDPAQWTVVPGVGRAGRPFYVAVGESLREERTHLTTVALRTALTAAILAALCSTAIAWLGSRFVSRPVSQLVAHARAVAAGDFERRLSVRQSDEIGQLAGEMNLMSEELVAARGRLEAETQRRVAAVEQLRHADRLTTVGKLASGLAHELGTPLNVVHGYAKLIAARPDADAELREGAGAIAGQAERMTRLVRQLLDFARRRGPKASATDLSALAARVATLLGPTAHKRGLELRVRSSGPVTASVDATMIEQVLTNLVFNAIQASPQGGAPIEIGVGDCERGPEPLAHARCALLTVKDHGAGIPREDQPRVFEPFFTTKEVGDGTGLGLSVAYGIVQDHHGLLELESEVGVGTTFRVVLPCEALPLAEADAPLVSRRGVDPARSPREARPS